MEKPSDKLSISALVVGLNDEHFIKNCLSSVSFCDEIIFIDLGSSDATIDIAKPLATKIYEIERVPIIEIIHHEYAHKTKHDWILVLDPDEVISDNLKDEIVALFKNDVPDNIGGIIVPWLFYFKKKRLLGTPWGGVNQKNILFNRKKYELLPLVHRGRSVLPPYTNRVIEFDGNNFVYHFWMIGYSQFLEKHWRYIKTEPKSRYIRGERTGIKQVVKIPFKAFKSAFWTTKGYKDKLIGLLLSFFYTWYTTSCLIGLYFYQQKHDKK